MPLKNEPCCPARSRSELKSGSKWQFFACFSSVCTLCTKKERQWFSARDGVVCSWCAIGGCITRNALDGRRADNRRSELIVVRLLTDLVVYSDNAPCLPARIQKDLGECPMSWPTKVLRPRKIWEVRTETGVSCPSTWKTVHWFENCERALRYRNDTPEKPGRKSGWQCESPGEPDRVRGSAGATRTKPNSGPVLHGEVLIYRYRERLRQTAKKAGLSLAKSLPGE
jgi:hypothetical protein